MIISMLILGVHVIIINFVILIFIPPNLNISTHASSNMIVDKQSNNLVIATGDMSTIL